MLSLGFISSAGRFNGWTPWSYSSFPT